MNPAQTLPQKIALEIIAIIEEKGWEARLAGGCVRDHILGITPKDYDVATTALPEEICSIFEQTRFKVVPTGVEHGTVTLAHSGVGVEVTTLREDVETFGRQARVIFGKSFEQDANRRDFTMNAMFQDAKGQIFDFFGGQKDIAAKQLRFVGDPAERIKEDYLRILRLFRFWSRLGFEPETSTIELCGQLADGLSHVSQERKTSELLMICKGPYVGLALESMERCNILPYFQAMSPRDGWIKNIARLDLGGFNKNDLDMVILSYLFLGMKTEDHNQAVMALRASRKQVEFVLEICRSYQEIQSPMKNQAEALRLINRMQAKTFNISFLNCWSVFFRQALKQDGKKTSSLDEIVNYELKSAKIRKASLPVTAALLIKELKLSPGPAIGRLMHELETQFLNGDWSTKQQGLKKAKTLYQD
jgi:poly(A) polymerase